MSSGNLLGYPLIRFYLLLFVLSIPFWLMNPIADHLLDGVEVNLPLSALMAICPLIAAFILAGKKKGSNGIKKLMAIVFDLRKINFIVYMAIIFLMPAIMLLSYVVMRVLEMPLPALEVPWAEIPLFFVVFYIMAVCEETGWMGFAANPMIRRWGVLIAGIAMGTVWAVWHVVPYMQAYHTFYWIAGQCLFTVAIRVIMVIIYSRTNQSVFGCVLLHTMINVSWVMFPNYGSHYDPVITGMITVIVALILANNLILISLKYIVI